MEPMVVTRGKVDDLEHDFVSAVDCCLHHALDRTALVRLRSLITRAFESKQELIKSVRVAFDAVDRAFQRVDFSMRQNSAITRGHDRINILRTVNWSHSFFQFSRKELVERFELIKVINLHLVKLYAVDASESLVEVDSEIRGQG